MKGALSPTAHFTPTLSLSLSFSSLTSLLSLSLVALSRVYHSHARTHTHTHAHRYTHTHMHTYTLAHTHAHKLLFSPISRSSCPPRPFSSVHTHSLCHCSIISPLSSQTVASFRSAFCLQPLSVSDGPSVLSLSLPLFPSLSPPSLSHTSAAVCVALFSHTRTHTQMQLS